MVSITKSVIADMSEGVMAISHKGIIELVNGAALTILGREEDELVGQLFALSFFDEEGNDEFTETVLDAIRNRRTRQERYVPYVCGKSEKRLRVVSSCLHDNGLVKGIVLVISDVTELFDLRDAMKAMSEIRALNAKLEIRNKLITETFGRYLSDDIVREILDTPDGMKMGGSRRCVTILMSDLRGFTMLCERTEPKALITMLNHYFEEMYEEISRYKGTIIEFLGDGMFILFGAPSVTASHADDAVACAIAMQNRMRAVNEWNIARGYEPLSMGIGINTGDVILGNIGSEKRTKYGVMGPMVNMAGRIESLTTGGMILISSGTRRAVSEEHDIEDSFSCRMKGVHGETQIFHVIGIGGEYDLHLENVQDELTELDEPVRVKVHILKDKSVSGKTADCEITAVSASQVEVHTNGALQIYDNLMIDSGFDLYAKVVRTDSGNTFTLAFTAKGEGFDEWLRNLYSEC
jgi:adenylate cyclase